MEKIEALNRLNALLQKIDNYERASANLQEAMNNLSRAKNNYPARLAAFDAEHKPRFLADMLGEEPIRPHGAIKLAVPIYLAKMAKYKKACEAYRKKLPPADAAYREKYAGERESLAEQDTIEQQKAIAENEAALETAEKIYTESKTALEQDDLLSAKLKTKDIVSCLIDYLNDRRADTLKEAINLWFDEKRKDEEAAKAEAHRKEMIALEEERVRAAQAAEDYARQAAENAREAAEAARRVEWNQSYDS
jgi:hypothetical protein